jgi:hypothetical protein
MITFFSSAKPFRDRTAIQQRNAVNSWLRLGPDVEVMLFGTDEGVAEICAEYQLVAVPDVACTEFGTPLLSDMYARAQKYSKFPLLCYINADIILLEDFAVAAEMLAKRQAPFVMTGRRIDVDFWRELNFETDWRAEVRAAAAERGVPGATVCLDYFLFRRDAIPAMPCFAIGRPAWDNWLIMDVRRRRVDLIDASRMVDPIHQNHDYGHVPLAKGTNWEGPEADRNRNLALLDAPTFQPRLHSIYSATRVLTRWGVLPAWDLRHILWRIYVVLEYRNYRGRLLAAYYCVQVARQRAAAAIYAKTRSVRRWLGRILALYQRFGRMMLKPLIAYRRLWPSSTRARVSRSAATLPGPTSAAAAHPRAARTSNTASEERPVK